MPRVRVLRTCYDNRKRHREGDVVDWKLKPGESLPKHVEELDEDDRVKKGRGKGRAAPAPDPEPDGDEESPI